MARGGWPSYAKASVDRQDDALRAIPSLRVLRVNSTSLAPCESFAHFVRSVGSDRASSVTKKADQMVCLFRGWGGRIRTCACMDQNHVPYHLATPHRQIKLSLFAKNQGYSLPVYAYLPLRLLFSRHCSLD